MALTIGNVMEETTQTKPYEPETPVLQTQPIPLADRRRFNAPPQDQETESPVIRDWASI